MKVNATTSDENSSYPRERSHKYFLCKFFENEKHASDFMNGRLYANKLSYFQSLEEQDHAKRGDKHEGIIAWGQPGIVRIEIDGHDISNDLAGPASLSSNRLSEFNEVCMHEEHTQVQTTAHYAHLAQDSVKASTSKIAASIGADILSEQSTAPPHSDISE